MKEWRKIPGTGGDYEISRCGTVRSVARTITRKNGAILKLPQRELVKWVNSYGYLTVTLSSPRKHNRGLHQLIAETFIGPRPPGMQVRHLDGNKLNNSVENLAYGTPRENQLDRITHGTHNRGERCGTSVLTSSDVLKIMEDTRTEQAIAESYGVTRSAICGIKQRRSWRHLSGRIVGGRRKKLTSEQVAAIRQDDRVHKVIAEDYGVSREMVSMIKRGKRRVDSLAPTERGDGGFGSTGVK